MAEYINCRITPHQTHLKFPINPILRFKGPGTEDGDDAAGVLIDGHESIAVNSVFGELAGAGRNAPRANWVSSSSPEGGPGVLNA